MSRKRKPTEVKPATRQQTKAKQLQEKIIEDEDEELFIIDPRDQENFHRDFRKYRERNNLTQADEELHERDILPLSLNKVSQKIIIDEVTPERETPLMQPRDYSGSFQSTSFRIESVPLTFIEEVEEEYEQVSRIKIKFEEHSIVSTEQNHSAKKKQTKQSKRKTMAGAKLELLNKCIEQLQENAIPAEICHRDQEKNIIESFINEGIKTGGQSQALYISGVPGIGKTASVMEVHKKTKKHQFIYINAMNFTVPEQVYPFLLKELTGIEACSRNQACLLLTELFSSGHLPKQFKKYEVNIRREARVILIDECDQLMTPCQQVLYNLVDWPSYRQSKITMIMIANTMDFPERLKPKLQSRLGNHRLVFKPYNSSQIESIIAQRLQSLPDVFGLNTLQFIGKKLATVSTDIRKTLSVCRTAFELVKEQECNKVEIYHVKEAYQKIYDKPYHVCLRSFSSTLKLLIMTIALDIYHKGFNQSYLMQVLDRFNQLRKLSKEDPLCYDDLKRLLDIAASMKLVEIKEINILRPKNQTQLKQLQQSLNKDQYFNIVDIQIQLKIEIDDIKNALSEDPFFARFSNFF